MTDPAPGVRIVTFRAARHAAAFRAINLAWIEAYFAVEAKDREVLDNPRREIIDKGGAILMAENAAGAPVGAVALLAMADGGFELAKMGVVEEARGRGVGRMLMEAALAEARARGARRVYIETNSSLGPAIKLYEAYGFQAMAEPSGAPSPYCRCDVRLEKRFEDEPNRGATA